MIPSVQEDIIKWCSVFLLMSNLFQSWLGHLSCNHLLTEAADNMHEVMLHTMFKSSIHRSVGHLRSSLDAHLFLLHIPSSPCVFISSCFSVYLDKVMKRDKFSNAKLISTAWFFLWSEQSKWWGGSNLLAKVYSTCSKKNHFVFLAVIQISDNYPPISKICCERYVYICGTPHFCGY